MRSALVFLGAGLISLFAAAATAAEPPRITWALVDGPPYHLGRPERIDDLGQGITDRLVAQLARTLPRYQHEVEWMSRQGLWKRMREGRPLCYADSFVTASRLRWALMSEVTPGVPQVVVARADTLPQGPVSLKALLSRPDLHGAFESQRSYGPHLDSLIASANRAPSNLTLPNSPALLRMLEAGRMDYFVEFPTAVQHHIEQLPQPAPRVDMHRIEEDEAPPPTAVACTRSEWGRQVITDIDQALRLISAQSEGGAALRRWLPAALAKSESPRIERFYRERAKRSDIR